MYHQRLSLSYYILRTFYTTGPQLLVGLLSNAPKEQETPFFFIEKHTRSWKAAGWLDVLWHAPFHLAPSSHLSCLPRLNMSSLGLPPHTPYLGTPILFPPEHRSVSFFECLAQKATNLGYSAFIFKEAYQRTWYDRAQLQQVLEQ